MATVQKRRNADDKIVYRVRIRRKGFPRVIQFSISMPMRAKAR